MATVTHFVKQHVMSVLSVSAITLNLLIWMLPVIVVVTGRALSRSQGARAFWYRLLDWMYRTAVRFNSSWVTHVLRVDIKLHGEMPHSPQEQLIVLSNHRSWFDVLVLHRLVTTRGPIVKFLIKRELIYVPVVGWLCLALDFPRLNRGKSDEGRARDYQSVMAAADSLHREPGALLNFAEGTRFTPAKHRSQASPFRHLLMPRAGGMRIMLEALPRARILDCTLAYPAGEPSFWQCLGGDLRQMEVWLDYIDPGDVGEVNDWLASRWQLKDHRIDTAAVRAGTTA